MSNQSEIHKVLPNNLCLCVSLLISLMFCSRVEAQVLKGFLEKSNSPQETLQAKSNIINWQVWNVEYRSRLSNKVALLTGINDPNLWPEVQIVVNKSQIVENIYILEPGQSTGITNAVINAIKSTQPPPFPRGSRFPVVTFKMGNTNQFQDNSAPIERY